MNKRNDWESLLKIVNEDVKENRYEIIVRQDEDGYYFVDIKHGDETSCFAENYFEEELSDCINDAWANVRNRIRKGKNYIVSYVGLSTSEDDAYGYNEVFLYDNYDEAREKMLALFENEKENITQMEDTSHIESYETNYICVSWAGGEEKVKIYIHEVTKP